MAQCYKNSTNVVSVEYTFKNTFLFQFVHTLWLLIIYTNPLSYIITATKTSVLTNTTYIIRCYNFVNVHVTDCHVKVAILTQYRRVSSSLIHLGGIYTTCNLPTIKYLIILVLAFL